MTDWEFVFDGVVGFLTSPIWNVPIVTFIEKNCVVFEPTDENELTYTEIHKEYGALVEELLTSYLKDVGITEEQFVSACDAGSNDSSKVPDRSIFEQVWAGEDFKLFKKIMVKQNLDLEIQALHMIQQRNGVVPEVFASENEKSAKKQSKQRHPTDEEKLLKDVMERSRQDYENEKGKKKEIERMEKTLALSKEESERLHDLAEQELNELERMVKLSLRLESVRKKDETSNTEKKNKKSSECKNEGKLSEVKSTRKPSAKETPKTATKKGSKKETKTSSPQPGSVEAKSSSTKQNSETSSSRKARSVAEPTATKASKNEVQKPPPSSDPVQAKPSPPSKRQASTESQLPLIKGQRTPAEAAADWISSAKAEVGTSSINPTEPKNREKTPMEDEIKKRAMYMRLQRDKLSNLKMQERARRLQTFEDELPVKRPMSSQVAHRVAQGIEAAKPVALNEDNEQERKKLALRQVLAERLKKEVIKQQNVE